MAQDDERSGVLPKEHAAVPYAETLPTCCSSGKSDWQGGYKKSILAKIPIVIAEPKIQINVESVIRLEDKALEIKRIYKNLLLTQCELIPLECDKRGKLFLSGFIRKNIEYATARSIDDCTISGDIRHITAKIPFTCVAIVDFTAKPLFYENFLPVEVEVLNQSSMGKDPNRKQFIQHVNFNDNIFYELVEAKFREIDIKNHPKWIDTNETVFDTLTEKIVVDLKIKILQNQQVEIPKYGKKDGWDHEDWDEQGCGDKKGLDGRKLHKDLEKEEAFKNDKCGTWEY